MKLEKRLRALERRMLSDPVVLFFEDGTTRELSGPKGFLLHLFCDTCRGAGLTPGQAEQLDLIRRSVTAREPGGGHMIEVVRCALNAPTEERGSGREDDE